MSFLQSSGLFGASTPLVTCIVTLKALQQMYGIIYFVSFLSADRSCCDALTSMRYCSEELDPKVCTSATTTQSVLFSSTSRQTVPLYGCRLHVLSVGCIEKRIQVHVYTVRHCYSYMYMYTCRRHNISATCIHNYSTDVPIRRHLFKRC